MVLRTSVVALRRIVVLACLAMGALAACKRAAPPARPVAEEFIEVPYPPPPAQIEEIQPELAGRPECRYVDGHYEWRSRRWQWVTGDWFVTPRDCRHAAGVLSYGRPPNPRLYYTPPRWYPTKGNAACEPAIPCLNRLPQNNSP